MRDTNNACESDYMYVKLFSIFFFHKHGLETTVDSEKKDCGH